MGALDKIVGHELDLRRQSAAAKDRDAPIEEARRRRSRVERHNEAKRSAMREANRLVGRVIFPARWTVTEGDRGWLACVAAFDGKIELRYFYHPHTDKIATMKVRPLRCPAGLDRWPEITDPTRPRLVDALIAWGLA